MFLLTGDGVAGGEGDQQRYRPAQPGGGYAQSPGVHLHRHPAARSDNCNKMSMIFMQVQNLAKGTQIKEMTNVNYTC